jgi:hypothetical protein
MTIIWFNDLAASFAARKISPDLKTACEKPGYRSDHLVSLITMSPH